ncbi:S8 family peptidase [Streptomyces sp. NPDC052701]|uniref:S8 family peptidase n=1 Tax=Streptomyces sp. NPDC052701 TaxID=3155533 RepID=UPI0034134C8E
MLSLVATTAAATVTSASNARKTLWEALRVRSAGLKTGSLLAVASLALGMTLGIPPRATAASAGPISGQSVTLLTGDRVVFLDAKREVKTIVPGKGRDKMAFSTYQRNGHLFVVPRDAVVLVRQGRVDERLFDVTMLLDSGYGDSKRSTLPLIVTYAPGVARAQLAGAKQTQNLASINSSAVRASRDGSTWKSVLGAGVRKVWLDAVMHASLDRSVPQIGGPQAWEAGYTGAGVKVAVLDTGVDETHPDLAGRQIAERNFSGTSDNVDRNGHGTHVASIIAGTGAKSDGKFKGVAYDAQFLDGKVLDDDGNGMMSGIIAGMQWAVDQGAQVVNMSMGGRDFEGVDPLEEAVDKLSKTGTLFVVAAGNGGGSGDGTIQSPGSADAALTVGAVDRHDNLASFSSRGPRVGDGAIKPDITAPGVGIMAAKAAEGRLGDPTGDGYVALSGTSMATPHVAGSAVLLAQEHPEWTGQQIKAALTASAKPNAKLSAFAQGSGRVDAARAISQVVTTEPTSLVLGTQEWPHDDDQPLSKTVTYHNAGKQDVTLDISVTATGPDGSPAPAGMMTASTPHVTIPGGGTASVDVIADTRPGTLDGTFTGLLTATSRSTQVLTPIAVTREGESHTLTVDHIGLDGKPATANYGTVAYNIDTGDYYDLFSPEGRVSVRMPKGRYLLDSLLIAGHTSWLVYPSLDLTEDMSVDLDFRATRPTSITPPDNASLGIADVRYMRYNGHNDDGYGFSWVRYGGDTSDLWTAGVGPELPPNEFVTQYNTQWVGGKGDFYGLGYYANGSFPTGFTRVEKKENLGRVHATYSVPLPGKSGLAWSFPAPKFGPRLPGWWSKVMPVELPGERNEYYTPEALWSPEFWQMGPDGALEERLMSPPRSFRAGTTTQLPFNRGVFGPALPQSKYDVEYVTRTGDKILVNVPLWGDAAGNAGTSLRDKSSIVLYKDGVKVGESADAVEEFRVPPDAGDYVLSVEGVRSRAADVSTTVRAKWTFHSAHAGPTRTRLPLSVIRFTPTLDDDNSVAAGSSLIVPVTLQRQATNTGTVPRTLAVDASFDSGLTWKPVTVVSNAFAVVHHPNDARSVSLRARATDASGNSVEQTLIDAYKLH